MIAWPLLLNRRILSRTLQRLSSDCYLLLDGSTVYNELFVRFSGDFHEEGLGEAEELKVWRGRLSNGFRFVGWSQPAAWQENLAPLTRWLADQDIW